MREIDGKGEPGKRRKVVAWTEHFRAWHAALLVLVLFSAQSADPVAGQEFDPCRASFSVEAGEEIILYRLMSLFALPGETIPVRIHEKKNDAGFRMVSSAGVPESDGEDRWRWSAPEEAGSYTLRIIENASGDSITLKVFVRIPFSDLEGEYLNGYRIGKYPGIPLKNLPIYRPPAGFVEVTEENLDAPVSPHFRLGQFLCKQDGGYPRYLVLKTRLLLKLELILEKVNERGFPCNTFAVMSGYRTPYYNKMIGNVKYSRHLWGGAADIYIDEDPVDDMMDDLNKDGKNDYRDAGILYDIIDDMYGKPWYDIFMGGLGMYQKTRNHGPFVHVDVRGFRARWGE